MDSIIIEKIKKEIENFQDISIKEEIGYVSAVGDGVAQIDGLTNVMMAEMVRFDINEKNNLEDSINNKDDLFGLILNLEEESVRAVILGEANKVKEGMKVFRTKKILSIPVGSTILGRVIDPLGNPIDGGSEIPAETYYPIERDAYGVIDRSQVNTPIHTGYKAVDAMIPIGRGQRELIIGDRSTGKTTLAIDTILSQKFEHPDERPICIYVAIGQKESKTARIVHELKSKGAMEYSVVISAPASASAALQFLAPYAGAAIGEFFMEQGKDAIVIYDDLSKQAVAYRQLSLLLRRPPGREAYPGDIFYLHSRLLERSAKLNHKLKGGSLTALPIIETQEGDVSAYIPTNVISITDGQIYLDTDLFNKGMKPAINVGISVSRVGSAAQTKAMKKVAAKIRLELAQFRELESFMQFAQDLDKETKDRIEKGRRLSELLTQSKHNPYPFEKQVAIIYAGVNGYFDNTDVKDIHDAEEALLAHIDTENPELWQKIKAKKELDEETEGQLKNDISDYFSNIE
jgi:F-type H+-transporting ATPase subunit alpha